MLTARTDALKKLQKELSPLQGLVIENPIDLFYLLQKEISTGTLLILSDQIHLFVDGRYLSAFSKFTTLTTHPSEKEAFFQFCKKVSLSTLFFDATFTSYERYEVFKKKLDLELVGKPQVLRDLRLIKSQEEILKIKASSKLLIDVYRNFLLTPKIGLSEIEIAQSFKKLAFAMGADELSFEPIMAAGVNGAYPHHRPSSKKLEQNEALLIDIGLCCNHYQSDMTRMVFYGNVSKRILKMYDEVLEAHAAALSLCKSGSKVGDLDAAAREVFRKYNDEKLYTHSLGHGLGLETHEAPRLHYLGVDKDLILKPGMVITIEPGLYEEGVGGIRHEDLILITDSGYENFYPGYL